MIISDLLGALSAGKQLENSAGWKNVQSTTSAVVALMGAVLAALSMAGIHPQITTEQIGLIAGGIAGMLGVLNSYATVATTKTIGLPSGGGNPDGAGKPDPTDVIG